MYVNRLTYEVYWCWLRDNASDAQSQCSKLRGSFCALLLGAQTRPTGNGFESGDYVAIQRKSPAVAGLFLVHHELVEWCGWRDNAGDTHSPCSMQAFARASLASKPILQMQNIGFESDAFASPIKIPIHMDRYFYWCGWRDSNPRPHPWQGCALSAELHPLVKARFLTRFFDYTIKEARYNIGFSSQS